MKIYGSFPALRMRRMRRDEFSRRLMRETTLSPGDLIYPVFILDGKGRTEKVASMPGVERMTVDRLLPARVRLAASRWWLPLTKHGFQWPRCHYGQRSRLRGSKL